MPGVQPPSGTVTFLFTDIEGSTKLWVSQPKRMQLALDRYELLVRQSIEQAGGFVFKTVGDAFCAAFSMVPDALTAALAAQIALGVESWPEDTVLKVRMALHTGSVEGRDGDYLGQPLSRVARLLATGHGGQTLLSQTTFELVRDFLPEGASLRDLGEHQLKDLARPEQVSQLQHPELRIDFPPLRSLDNPELRHNLPRQATTFVGREREIAEVHELLGRSRLLTVTGSGGSGKTRLILQLAADQIDEHPDGVWFVELAPLSSPAFVAQTVGKALGLNEEPGKPILRTIADNLKNKRTLVLLDNCEHVLEACAAIADTLIRECPQVRVLSSSREALGITGERTYLIPSMSLPDPKAESTALSLSQYEAVQLFIERADLQRPGFTVTNQNAPALASICYRLDGIPLAIELAAARVRSLSLEEINRNLDHRFRLLTGGSRTALPRQQTLRSLIDWSYDLLNVQEKRLLQRVSVFSAGWTLESAEAICAGEGLEDWEIMNLNTTLADKSLVVVEQREAGTRFRLLETVKEYARDRLMEAGQVGSLRDRHLARFLALAEEIEPDLIGPNQMRGTTKLEAEQDNLRAALEWSKAKEGGLEAYLRLGTAIGRFWSLSGQQQEGRAWAFGLLDTDLSSIPLALQSKTFRFAGILATERGDFDESKLLHETALAIRREMGDLPGIGASLIGLGNLSIDQGQFEAAKAYFEEALVVKYKIGDHSAIGAAYNNLGNVANYQGDYRAAQELYRKALAILRELKFRFDTAICLSNLGNVAMDLREYDEAKELYAESFGLRLDLGANSSIRECLESLAGLFSVGPEPIRAPMLWGAVEKLREEMGSPLPPVRRSIYARRVQVGRDAVGDEVEFEKAWNEGRSMTIEQAVALAQVGLTAPILPTP